MEAYSILKDLAIIVIFAKIFGIVARKLKAPQVVGEIIAGLIIGPCILGLVQQTEFITQMAEIGVILLMFSAGLGTDLKELLRTGPVAFLIALVGVFVPLLGGTLLYMGFYGVSVLPLRHPDHHLFHPDRHKTPAVRQGGAVFHHCLCCQPSLCHRRGPELVFSVIGLTERKRSCLRKSEKVCAFYA